MSNELTVYSEEASVLADELSALTAETTASVVVTALRERLERLRADREQRALVEGPAILDRALRMSEGPGIPFHHCWERNEVLSGK